MSADYFGTPSAQNERENSQNLDFDDAGSQV